MAENYREVSFHGLVGSTHNYGGLAKGNIASEENAGHVSHPRAAFLQGLEHARLGLELGLCEAVLPPHPRPYIPYFHELEYKGMDEQIIEKVFKDNPALLLEMSSSAFMWSANAATVAPSCDTRDSKLHLTVSTMLSNLHREIESEQTHANLQAIFGDIAVVEERMARGFATGDEGAANHMRFAASHGEKGIHLFVYGENGDSSPVLPKKHPARQSRTGSVNAAFQNDLAQSDTLYVQQNPEAIDAGVFHNDVISMNNGSVWLLHEKAYIDTLRVVSKVYAHAGDGLIAHIATEDEMPLADAVSSYVFNSRIVTLPSGRIAFIAPIESRDNHYAQGYIESIIDFSENSIDEVHYIDLGQSMRNGGGPACLRLRVVMSEEERIGMKGNVILTGDLYSTLQRWGEKHYHEELHPKDLADPQLLRENHEGLDELTRILNLGSIYYFQKDGSAFD